MTSRLKRKLEDIGVDVTSRKANENFCLIGTPLPPLEKTKDIGEFVPLWKQDVRDEQGRKRLHGAFTGGWSAGYYNSVGSAEGWAPSTFVSSRAERAKKKAPRPEDYMDEEDLQDLRDSQKLVNTVEQADLTGIFGGAQAKQDDGEESTEDPFTKALARALQPSAEDSIGVKLLKKMGWRPGQGVGPRVSLKERKEEDAEAYHPVTGMRLLGDSLDLPDDDEEAQRHTYPRRDTPILIVKKKTNYHGLGYVPGLTINEQLGNKQSSGGPKLAGGFGLGALNDADEDDLDVYDHSSKQAHKKVAWDDAEDEDTITIGRRQERKTAKPQAPSEQQYFRDGTLVLPGFELSSQPVMEDRTFPMPDVPPGWKPNPKRLWAEDANKENQQSTAPKGPVSHEKWKKSGLSANDRGTALGETPIEAPARSIFDYISSKDKERLQLAAQQIAGGSTSSTNNNATSDQSHATALPSTPASRSKIEPHIAQAALKGFQPFTNDPFKQARYNAYLTSQATTDDSVPPLQPLLSQSVQEFNKEIEDYAKAASLFKPITGAIASRFTTASIVEREPEIREGLHQPTLLELQQKEVEELRVREERQEPKVHAAKMGMYGALTREVKVWIPVKLLCKRFGVKEPEIAPVAEGEGGVDGREGGGLSYTLSEKEKELASSFGKDPSVPYADVIGGGGGWRGKVDLENIGLGDDENQGKDILTQERPPMDVFKAIFASDEDSDEEGEGKGDEDKAEKEEEEEDKPKFITATSILDDQPFDPASFKPKFKSKNKSDDKKVKDKDKERGKEKKEKKEKKKKEKKGVLVSFQLDEEGGDEMEVKQPKDRPRKKKKTEENSLKRDEEDVAMSVDNPPDHKHPPPVLMEEKKPVDTAPGEGRLKARKRAIDFLDDD